MCVEAAAIGERPVGLDAVLGPLVRPAVRPAAIDNPVGAAVRTKSGRVFTGVNVENAAYPTTMCAERIAIFKAVSEGEREFDVIAVVTPNGGSPCGGCRQVLAEFGLDTIVLIGRPDGSLVKETSVEGLLPEAFTPGHLGKPPA